MQNNLNIWKQVKELRICISSRDLHDIAWNMKPRFFKQLLLIALRVVTGMISMVYEYYGCSVQSLVGS